MNNETGGPAFPHETETDIYQGMTLRQYAAIKLKVPDSGEPWLDAMIVKSLRDDFASKSLVTLASVAPEWSSSESATWAYIVADAMLEARK